MILAIIITIIITYVIITIIIAIAIHSAGASRVRATTGREFRAFLPCGMLGFPQSAATEL